MNKKHSDIRSRFAQRLRAIRIPRGYKTARSFAVALGIDENRYTRYERAEVEPDLQLLMKICSLLDATPNDLLCDMIGAQPIDIDVAYGFSERSGPAYLGTTQPQQARTAPVALADSLAEARKAAGWELATVVAMVEARGEGLNPDTMPELDKLRRIGPIHARVAADPFLFLGELPERLGDIDVPPEVEAHIGRLTQEMVATRKPGANDNG